MPLANRRFEFAAITEGRWRLVAKELIMALLAPHHPAAAPLPRAYRTPLHLSSAVLRLNELVRFFDWLGRRAITSLAALDTPTCEAYLNFRRYVSADDGTVVGEQSHVIRRIAAQIIIDLVDYRDLFTADRVRADLRPWGGATATAVAEMPSGRTGNKTPPVADEVLQPMLAAALHLVEVLGPHAVELSDRIRETDRMSSLNAPGLRHSTPTAVDDIIEVLTDHTTTGTPLPMLEAHDIDRRLAAGWSTDDPLLPVATGVVARQAGYSQLWRRWKPALREPFITAATSVGVQKMFARNAAQAAAADGSGHLPWTLPLHRSEAAALIGIVRTATIVALAAASGMRSSELMELRVGCRRPIEEPLPGLKRFRIASKIVKGQPLGGTGSSSNPPTAPSNRRAAPRRPPRRRTAVRPVLLPGPLHLVAELGELKGGSPTRSRPDPRRPSVASHAQKDARPRNGLPARWCSRRETAPKSTSRRQQRRDTPHGPAGLRPSCWPRSTSTKPTATSNSCWPSSAITSGTSCPPGRAPAA